MEGNKDKYSEEPFAKALHEIVRRHTGPLHRVELKPILDAVPGYSYEQLRKMVVGDSAVTMRAMEGIAEVIKRVDPTFNPMYFMEYRFMWLSREMLRNPALGHRLFEYAQELSEKGEL